MCQSCRGFSSPWKTGWEELGGFLTAQTDRWLTLGLMWEGWKAEKCGRSQKNLSLLYKVEQSSRCWERRAENVKMSHVHSGTRGDRSREYIKTNQKDFRGLSLFAQDGLVSEIKRYIVREYRKTLLLRSHFIQYQLQDQHMYIFYIFTSLIYLKQKSCLKNS